jgi:hypothetical protein
MKKGLRAKFVFGFVMALFVLATQVAPVAVTLSEWVSGH